MRKAISIRDFTILLITSLAKDSKIIDYKNPDKKVAVLPVDYKQRIENILCAENGWKEKFSSLIDVKEYFKDHFIWEDQLAIEIKKTIQQMNKDFEYDFSSDSINISFTQKEIELILSKYKDNKIKNIMNHFVALMNDFIYSRKYQEEYHDYSSRSVQYIKKLNKENR